MKIAQRIQTIPPYLFAEIDKKKEEALKRGVDIINLGIGDPDQPTPNNIIEKLRESVKDSKAHHYPPYQGTTEFRQAVASWYKNRFRVNLALWATSSSISSKSGKKSFSSNKGIR